MEKNSFIIIDDKGKAIPYQLLDKQAYDFWKEHYEADDTYKPAVNNYNNPPERDFEAWYVPTNPSVTIQTPTNWHLVFNTAMKILTVKGFNKNEPPYQTWQDLSAAIVGVDLGTLFMGQNETGDKFGIYYPEIDKPQNLFKHLHRTQEKLEGSKPFVELANHWSMQKYELKWT